MAVADLTQAVRIDPGNAQAYFERALIWPSGEERELDDFDKAIRLDPESADYREKRARAYQARSDHDHAITDLTEVGPVHT